MFCDRRFCTLPIEMAPGDTTVGFRPTGEGFSLRLDLTLAGHVGAWMLDACVSWKDAAIGTFGSRAVLS